MTAKSLKKKLVESINSIEDKNLLMALEIFIENKKENINDYILTPEQDKELLKINEEIKNGTAKLIPWEVVEKRLLKERKLRKSK